MDIRKSLLELKDFDKARVQAIVERWESARHQIDNRLVGLVQAEQQLEKFQGGLRSEMDWLSIVEEKVEDRLWSAETDNADEVMEELTVSTELVVRWRVMSLYELECQFRVDGPMKSNILKSCRENQTDEDKSSSSHTPLLLMVFTVTSPDCKVKKARFHEFLSTLGWR